MNADIPVHDIYPLVEVSDYSLYYFLALVLIGAVAAASLFFWFLKRLRSRKENPRKRAYERLASIDFSNPKRAAYAISETGRVFAQDSERTGKAYQNLFERLERYKYAPSVGPIDAETVGYYRLYLEMIDV